MKERTINVASLRLRPARRIVRWSARRRVMTQATVADGRTNRLAVTNALGFIETAWHDALGRLESVNGKQFEYDADGNLMRTDAFAYSYDAANRLVSVTDKDLTNGSLRVVNKYDAMDRRVQKEVYALSIETGTANDDVYEWNLVKRHTFVYDDWNPVLEKISYTNGTEDIVSYVWGSDLSGSLQGAGGVGGLLWVKRNGEIFIPCYDVNGNIVSYLNRQGESVASYSYDAFGGVISSSGECAEQFSYRFSTKYRDPETELYYYGCRFYSPALSRWLNRDPIEEEGGLNLYAFCLNNGINSFDVLGLKAIIIENPRVIVSCIDGVIRAHYIFLCDVKVSCNRNRFQIYGEISREIEILEPSHPMWKKRFKRYDAKWGKVRSNVQEQAATYQHELDHWKSYDTFFNYVKELNNADGDYLGRCCEKIVREIRLLLEMLKKKAIKKSDTYDLPNKNQGGLFPL